MPDLEACSLEWVCCLIEVICDHRSYQQLLVFYLLTVLLFLLYCWFAAAATENHKTLPKSVGTFLNPQMQPRQLTAFVVVHPLSQVRLCNPMDCSTPGSSVLRDLQSLLKFMSMELVMLSNHLILCYPLLLLPSVFPTIRVFSSELTLRIRWPKYCSFGFSISLYNEYSVLIFSVLTIWSPCCPREMLLSNTFVSSDLSFAPHFWFLQHFQPHTDHLWDYFFVFLPKTMTNLWQSWTDTTMSDLEGSCFKYFEASLPIFWQKLYWLLTRFLLKLA